MNFKEENWEDFQRDTFYTPKMKTYLLHASFNAENTDTLIAKIEQ